MLELPQHRRGFSQYGDNKGREYDLDVLCDWIEGSVLFLERDISLEDVSDHIMDHQSLMDSALEGTDRLRPENDILSNSSKLLADTWNIIEKRLRSLGNSSPLELGKNRIRAVSDWRDFPGYSFTLLLGLKAWYPDWAALDRNTYAYQGALFEQLSKAALAKQLSGWRVERTGWGSDNTINLASAARFVADCVFTDVDLARLELFDHAYSKDRGLDIVAYRPFPDERIGSIAVLLQCGSGKNWAEKLNDTGCRVWRQIVQWPAENKPPFGLIIPFALQDEEFKRSSNLVAGPLLDRQRLLGLPDSRWEPGDLARDLVEWAEPLVELLPST